MYSTALCKQLTVGVTETGSMRTRPGDPPWERFLVVQVVFTYYEAYTPLTPIAPYIRRNLRNVDVRKIGARSQGFTANYHN